MKKQHTPRKGETPDGSSTERSGTPLGDERRQQPHEHAGKSDKAAVNNTNSSSQNRKQKGDATQSSKDKKKTAADKTKAKPPGRRPKSRIAAKFSALD